MEIDIPRLATLANTLDREQIYSLLDCFDPTTGDALVVECIHQLFGTIHRCRTNKGD